MAEHKYQQQDHRAGLQHLAHLQQDSAQPKAQVLHQHRVALAEAALEAHLRLEQLQYLQLKQDSEANLLLYSHNNQCYKGT